MTVKELAEQLKVLIERGYGDAEVRLRASRGDRVQVRTGVSGLVPEKRCYHDEWRDSVLIWGWVD